MLFYTKEVEERVQRITGLTGKPLDLVTTAAIITAEIGKYPTKVDICTCVGMTEREMNIISQEAIALGWARTFKEWYHTANLYVEPTYKAMVYSISADLVAEGLAGGNVDERARGLMKTVVNPQQIQTKAQFDGFLTMMEYLHHSSRGLDTSFSSFLAIRYGTFNKSSAVRAFAKMISENDPDSFPNENCQAVAAKLAELLKVID